MKKFFSLPALNSIRSVFIRILTFIGGFVFFLFLSGLVIGALTDKRSVKLPDNIVLSLEVKEQFKEKSGISGLTDLLSPSQSLTIHEIVGAINHAAKDKRVHGLYVKLDGGDYGLAHIQEFRDAIAHFQTKGKFAYLYSNSFGGLHSSMAEYYMASLMNEVWMQPVGTVSITGYSLQMPFLREALDKIGIEPEVIAAGQYKSAPEIFTRNGQSESSQKMNQNLLRNLSDQFISDVSFDRDISPDTLKTLIAQAPMTDHHALKSGLVDSIGYWDEFLKHIQNEAPKDSISVDVKKYNRAKKKSKNDVTKFALIQASGAITSLGEGATLLDDQTTYSEEIWDAFHDAMNDQDIKAIIFRVDSPGGSPVASETIRRAVILAKQKKTVIVSMGNTAASGGYWISVDASAIIAQPATLTGSIGVFAMKPNLQGFWDKLGIHWDIVKQNDGADIWSPHKALSEDEKAKLQTLINYTYEQFIERVASGRNMAETEVRKIAEGRVWTGEQALKNGLVDGLGGVETAVSKGKELSKISHNENVVLVPYPKPLSPLAHLLKMTNHNLAFIPQFISINTLLTSIIKTTSLDTWLLDQQPK